MRRSDAAAIDGSLRAAVCRLAGALPTDDVVDYLDHGESGIALDELCEHLYEAGVAIDDATRELIAVAGRLMHMNPLLWERLVPSPRPALDDTWWLLTTGEPMPSRISCL